MTDTDKTLAEYADRIALELRAATARGAYVQAALCQLALTGSVSANVLVEIDEPWLARVGALTREQALAELVAQIDSAELARVRTAAFREHHGCVVAGTTRDVVQHGLVFARYGVRVSLTEAGSTEVRSFWSLEDPCPAAAVIEMRKALAKRVRETRAAVKRERRRT